MKCLEAQESLGTYWDLSAEDSHRQQIEEHLMGCDSCRAEYEIWRESRDLIQIASHDHEALPGRMKNASVSMKIMDRIYQDEAWRIPVSERTYQWSARIRRHFCAVIAFCMALFIVSFFASVLNTETTDQVVMYGIKAPAIAIVETSDGSVTVGEQSDAIKLLVASISEPPAIRMDAVPKDPNYYVALSLLGLISTLLIMNWLSRVRV